MKKNHILGAAVALAVSGVALASTSTDTDFDSVVALLKGWMQGSLGRHAGPGHVRRWHRRRRRASERDGCRRWHRRCPGAELRPDRDRQHLRRPDLSPRTRSCRSTRKQECLSGGSSPNLLGLLAGVWE